jgi:hypothetical protein
MDIKYLSDPKGTITGVFIPIEDWMQLKKQYNISEDDATESSSKLQKGLSDALKKAKIEPDTEE